MAAVLALAGVVWVRASSGPPIAAGTVVRVVDGDTVIVRGPGGSTEDVRMIGIDTPETVDPRRPVGCFGTTASCTTATAGSWRISGSWAGTGGS